MNSKKRLIRGLARKLVVLFCLALLVLVSATLHAQEAGTNVQTTNVPNTNVLDASAPMRLTPDQAVDLAIKNNLGLESSRTSLATKRRASNLSWNQFIPNVTVAGVLNRANEASSTDVLSYFPWDDRLAMLGLQKDDFEKTIPTVGTIYNYVMPFSVDLPQWNVAASIQASMTISLAMFENMRRLRIDYENGLYSYEKAKLQLERDVRKAYHNILLLQENIAVLRGSFANVESQVQMAQANYRAGLVPELVLLQARVARENMRPVIDQVENLLKLALAGFSMYLGMDYDAQFELIPVTATTEFIPIDISEMIKKAASSKPDIQELRQMIMMMESARRAQILSLSPVLSLGWNSTSTLFNTDGVYPMPADPWKDSWFGSGSEWRKVSGAFSITLALRLHSLIPFSMDFQGIRTMDDQIKTATIGLAQMVVGTEIEVYNTVLALDRTRTNAAAQVQTVNLAEQSYRQTLQAYRAGLQDYFQVQNAEQSLRQARVQLLEQQFNYLNGLIDLEYSIGVPFGTLSGRSK